MKKLILILTTIFLTSAIFAQVEKSDYEKYYEAREAAKFGDTIRYDDTLTLKPKKAIEKPEFDDVYYIPTKDELKLKSKGIRLDKRKIRIEQQAEYYDAKQEVYNDLYYSQSLMFSRFYFSYRPAYYFRSSWDYFMYDSYMYDPYMMNSWYWGLNWYSYNNYFYRPYYNRYNNSFYGHNYYGNNNYRQHNNYYGNNGYGNGYGSGKINNVQYGRRDRPSTLTQSTANRPVAIQNRTQARTVTTQDRRTVTSPQEKPMYNRDRGTYSPTYNNPRMATRPAFNNSNVGRNSTTTNVNRNGVTVTPQHRQASQRNVYNPASTQRNTSTQSRTYSTPNKSAVAPTRAPSSAPTRSYGTQSRSTSINRGS